MTWPAADVVTTDMDAGTDSPASARAQLLDLATKFNQIRNHFSTYARNLAAAVDAAAARTALGATSVGAALFIATSTAAARTALGATSVGSSLFTASSASAARGAIDAPSETGSGASGTWPISITGSAAEAYYVNRSLGTSPVLGVHQFASTSGVIPLMVFDRTAAAGYLWSFERGSSQVGSIYLANSGTNFNTTSDQRLKEDVGPVDSGPLVDAVPVHRFRWRHLQDEPEQIGFFAQEVAAVIGGVVMAGSEAGPGESGFRAWGGDWSKLVPILWAEVQSLRARVAALEGVQTPA